MQLIAEVLAEPVRANQREDVHVFLQVAGWLQQPTWKVSGVAVTRIL
jgi:hypothetical protein